MQKPGIWLVCVVVVWSSFFSFIHLVTWKFFFLFLEIIEIATNSNYHKTVTSTAKIARDFKSYSFEWKQKIRRANGFNQLINITCLFVSIYFIIFCLDFRFVIFVYMLSNSQRRFMHRDERLYQLILLYVMSINWHQINDYVRWTFEPRIFIFYIVTTKQKNYFIYVTNSFAESKKAHRRKRILFCGVRFQLKQTSTFLWKSQHTEINLIYGRDFCKCYFDNKYVYV